MSQRRVKDKHLQCVWTLQNLFPIEISLLFKNYLLLLSAGHSHMCEKKGLSQNIASKFASKVTRKVSETVLKSWASPFLYRPKSVTFVYLRKLNFWIISFEKECLYGRICTDILLHIRNYNKLQYSITFWNSPLIMLLVCLGTTINFSYIWPICFKATCKVTLKLE